MRIFLSHSHENNAEARAVKKWLIDTERSLEGEVFLDLDDLLPGTEWKAALQAANRQCEAVICLLSTAWENSEECRLEYRYGETLNKDILCARLEKTASAKTRAWQHCDLFVKHPGAETVPIALDDGTDVVLAADGLRKLQKGLIELGAVRDYFRWPPADDPERSPYRGWADLDIDDAAVFFGRDAEIVSALDTLKGMHKSGVASMLVIQGSSGAGKSAFLRAGLLPRIHQDSRFLSMDVVRPEHDVLTGPNGLAKAIDNLRKGARLHEPELLAIEKGCQTGDVSQIVDWLDEARRAAPLSDDGAGSQAPPTIVLTLDQAEELFATPHPHGGTSDDTERFLQIIAALLTHRDGTTPAVMMLATVRADSYEFLQNSPTLADVGSVSFNELTPMNPSLFSQVIKGPAARHTKDVEPLVIDPKLFKELIDDCPDADALPLLALTLEQLITRYGKTGTRTLDEYEQLGRVDRIVDTIMDDVVGTTGDPQRDGNLDVLRRAFIPAMASINVYDQPQRRLAHWDNLPPDSHALLTKLTKKHVLTKTDRPGGAVIEVAIESLLRRWSALTRWLSDESRYLKIAQRVELSAHDWDKHDRTADHLEHRGERLRGAEKLAAEGRYFTDPDIPTADYLKECRRSENWHRLTRRVLTGTAALLAVGLFAAAVLAVQGFRESHMRFREATAERLTSEGQAMLAGARPNGDFRAIQQLIAAPLVTSPDKLGLGERLLTAPMSASPSVSGALLDAVNSRRDLHKIVQTNAKIASVAFNRDASIMATGDIDGDIRLWKTATAESRGGQLHTRHGVVWSVAFAGDRLVTSANDGTVEIWNSAGHAAPLSGSQIGKPTRSIAATTDGQFVVAGSADGKMRIWNTRHQDKVRVIDVPGGPVQSVALHGNVIATGSENGTVQRWSLPDGARIGDPINVDGRPVWCVTFSPDGHRIAAAGQSRDVWIHNLETGARNSLAHRDGVWTVAFDPDGKYIATGGTDDTIKVWNATTYQKIGDLVTGDGGDVKSTAFTGDRLVSVGDDKTVRLWKIPSPPPAMPTEYNPVVGLSLGPNRIVTTTAAGVLQRWNPDQTKGTATDLQATTSTPAAVDTAGAYSAVITPRHTVEIWTVDGQATGVEIRLPADITDGAIAVGGDRLAATSRRPDTVRFRNIHDGTEVGRPVDMGDRQIRSMRLSSNGKLLATADNTGRIDVWDTDSGDIVSEKPMAGDTDPDIAVRRISLAFSDDNRRLVSGAVGDDQVREWDVAAGTQIGESMTGHQVDVTTVAFSHDDRFIISGAEDGTVRIWDAVNQRPAGQPLAIQQPPSNPEPNRIPLYPTTVAVSGQLIVAGLNDGTVRTWPGPETWAELLCEKVTGPLTADQWKAWVGPEVNQIGTCP